MPTAQEFFASGRGNGFPFCLKIDTAANITAIDGNTLSPEDETVLRAKEVTRAEAIRFFGDLKSVSFASKTIGGFLIDFDDGDYGYGALSDGATNVDLLDPHERVCVGHFDLDYSSYENDADLWGAAQGAAQGGFSEVARFEIHDFAYASDTDQYYLIYGAGYYADDEITLEQEADWSDLTFNYHTY
jgi:hypothetical protein